MLITTHFDSFEFDCNDGTPYPLTLIDDGTLPELCDLLELIRAIWDKPITINSGFRTTEYNTKIGGAKDSQHMRGRAADIIVQDILPFYVHQGILKQYNIGYLPSLGGLGYYRTFTHVDTRKIGRLARWSGSRIAN